MANCNWLGRAVNINCEHCDFTGNCGCGDDYGRGYGRESIIPDCDCGCGCDYDYDRDRDRDCDCGCERTTDRTFGTNGTAWTSERCCNTFTTRNTRGRNCGCEDDCDCDCGCKCR